MALSVAMIFLGAKGIESTVTMDSFVKSLIQRPKHMMDTSKSPLEILSLDDCWRILVLFDLVNHKHNMG